LRPDGLDRHAADDRDDIAGETGGIGMQHIISVIEQSC
jgi:hypothetical protein